MKYVYIILLFICSNVVAQNPSSSGYLLTNANGTVSIGTRVNTAPLTVANFTTTFPAPQIGTMLHIVSDNTVNGRVSMDVFNNASITGANYQGRRGRGTAALPTAPLLDDVLVAIGADGYGDDSFTGVSVGSMNIRAFGTFTNASKPTYISFTTTPTGSTTQAERFRIKADGTIQITGLTEGVSVTDGSGNLSIVAGTAGQFLRRNAGNTAYEFATLAGGGDLLAANNLSDVASAATSRTNLGLGNVNNTSDANKPISTATQTALDLKANTTSVVTRVFLPGDVANSNAVANTIADVTGLSFPVVANTTYKFKFFIVYTSAATTTGSRWSINGVANTFMNYTSQYTLTATSITNNAGVSAYNTPSGVSASSLAAGNICIIEGMIRPTANGDIIARFASEISSSAITALGSGRSYVEYQAIN